MLRYRLALRRSSSRTSRNDSNAASQRAYAPRNRTPHRSHLLPRADRNSHQRQEGSRPDDSVRSRSSPVAFELRAKRDDRSRHFAGWRRGRSHNTAHPELFGGGGFRRESSLPKIYSRTAESAGARRRGHRSAHG